jgi:hypothetical protein
MSARNRSDTTSLATLVSSRAITKANRTGPTVRASFNRRAHVSSIAAAYSVRHDEGHRRNNQR